MSPLAQRLAAMDPGAAQIVGRLGDGPARPALLRATASFDAGLRAALHGCSEVTAARPRIALEGLGMGATMLDILRPSSPPRVVQLLEGADARFVALGIGMAHARLGREGLPIVGAHAEHAWNGWGFQRCAMEPYRIRGAVRLGAKEHEQAAWIGAGRALWFLYAGDGAGLVGRLSLVDGVPRPWLYRGIGVANSFAGGASESACMELGAHCPDRSFADGVAHGAEIRGPKLTR